MATQTVKVKMLPRAFMMAPAVEAVVGTERWTVIVYDDDRLPYVAADLAQAIAVESGWQYDRIHLMHTEDPNTRLYVFEGSDS